MSEEEQVVKPDRIGSMDPAVTQWRAPTKQTRRVGKRIFETQQWIERQGRLVEEEEVIDYIVRHYGPMTRGNARETYLKVIVKEFKARGVQVYGESGKAAR